MGLTTVKVQLQVVLAAILIASAAAISPAQNAGETQTKCRIAGTGSGRHAAQAWQSKYGHGIELVETFVDRSRFHGGAYAASNWLEVGLTQGRSRGDRERRIQVPRKAVFVYPLSGQARQRLCQ